MIRMMVRLGAAGLLVLAACGDDEEQAPATPAAETAPTPAPQPAQPAQPANLESNFGTVTLAPSFMPDPHTVSGTSGGGVDASTWNADCAGWVSQTPDHILTATGAFQNLRVMAHSDGDVTLVVQKPDGSYACDDDSVGTDPLVAGAFPQGNYKIWIGSYEQGTNSQYTLGISELDTVNPSTLAQ